MSDATATMPSRADVMTQAGAENFPVAARLLAGPVAPDLLAIYGFARLVDDIGDEAEGDRGAMLDEVDGELDRVFAGEPVDHEVMRRLAATVRSRGLPRHPFDLLIAANRRDQEVDRYDTFDDLLDYCRLSAAPVGELVLHVFGHATPARLAQSERVCAGLQVVEHLQDVSEDLARGRVYLPRLDLARFEVAEEDLSAPVAGPRLRALIAFEGERARRLLASGAPLVRGLSGRARLTVAGFVAGGRATLRGLAAADHDVLGLCPRRSSPGFAFEFARTVTGR